MPLGPACSNGGLLQGRRTAVLSGEKKDKGQYCPICKSSQYTDWVEHTLPYSSKKFLMLQCDTCRCWHMDSPPTHEEARAFYTGDYYFFNRDKDLELERNYQLYRRSVRLIEKEVRDKRVLEIGCSKGYLLAILSKMGWHVQGVEISEEAAVYARSQFNLPVFTGDIENYAQCYPTLQYPLILALDVLEHVPDPFTFMKAVEQLLSTEGFLIIDTPNGESSTIKNERGAWKGFNPFHIHVFSQAGLQFLLSRNNLSVHSIYEYSYDPFASDRGGIELRIRSAIKSFLLQTGLFTKVYEQYKRIAMRKDPIKDPLLRMISRIESERHASPVFPKEFLREHGDNLVLLCKKS